MPQIQLDNTPISINNLENNVKIGRTKDRKKGHTEESRRAEKHLATNRTVRLSSGGRDALGMEVGEKRPPILGSLCRGDESL